MIWWSNILEIILVFLPEVFSSYDQAVCIISTHPIVYGQPVALLCSIKTSKCVANETRWWQMGPHMIMINGVPSNVMKCSEDIHSCSDFSLTIPAIYESYLNQEYTCFAGLSSNCKMTIKVSLEHFEFHPSRDTTELQVNDSSTGVTFSLYMQKVFPVPKCTINIGETRLDNFTITRINRFGEYYQVILEAKYVTHVVACPLVFNVTCLVGQSLIPLIHGEHNCTRSDVVEIFQQYFKVIIYCVLSIVSVVCLILLVCSIFRNKQMIMETFKNQLLKRSMWDNRRPILAVIATFSSVTMSVATDIIASLELIIQSQTVVDDFTIPVSFCVSSVLLTPLSLCFLSNPETVSIRQGFKTAGKRFVEKFRREHIPCTSTKQTGKRFVEKFRREHIPCTSTKQTDTTVESIPML